MANKNYILVNHYCENAHIESSFLYSLSDYGLVVIEERESNHFIDEEDITEIERLFRLYTDLGVNFEGLDVIKHMLSRMETMEDELSNLQKRLRLYQ